MKNLLDLALSLIRLIDELVGPAFPSEFLIVSQPAFAGGWGVLVAWGNETRGVSFSGPPTSVPPLWDPDTVASAKDVDFGATVMH